MAISLAGLPPLVGFVGKGMVFWHSLGHPALLAVALFSTGLSLVYYLYSLLLAYRAEGGPLLVKADSHSTRVTLVSYGLSALCWASQPLLLACAVLG